MTKPVASPASAGWPDAGPLQRELDQLMEGWSEPGGPMTAMDRLIALTCELSQHRTDPGLRALVQAHPISAMVRQDPFTDWSYRRPRGYPGDATLIDFIYGHHTLQGALDAATSVGRDVHLFTHGSEACVAVRERRRLLAHAVEAVLERVADAEVMAVACGHLREMELVRGAQNARRIVALDQDADSLREVRRCHGALGNVECVQARVARLFVRPTQFGRFDLIYAAGLYDYLDSDAALRLTTALFSALKPGGRLLFGNFARGIRDEGYMDAFMDWRLVLRDEADIEAMLAGVPATELVAGRVFRGNNRAIIYAMLEKAA
ncbi:MAG: class I SAM-dependent methyltransferase [Roseococcus sp.]